MSEFRIIKVLFSLCLLLSVFQISFSQNHQSYNNHTGNWETPSTWQIGNGNLANNNLVVIYGFVKRNSSLTLNNNIVLEVHDTLFIFGNLNIAQNGTINVHSNGMVVVYGNVTAYNNVNVDLQSYFVVLGNLDMRNGSEISSPPGDTLLYVSGGVSCSVSATCPPPGSYGDEDDLLDNPDIGGLILDYTIKILPSAPVLCPGRPVRLSIRSDGTNYQWYRNSSAIAGATSYHYDATQTGSYDVSFTVSGVNYPVGGNPAAVIVSEGYAAQINYIGSNSPVQDGNTISLQLDPGAIWPATVAGISWTGPNGFSSTAEDPSFTATSLSGGNYVAYVTTNQGCSTSASTDVQITPDPGACCSGFSYYSRNNYTGNWENATSWGNANTAWTPNPPPTNPMNSQTLCINGYITLNGSLTISGSNHKICDTLVITGDLDVQSYQMEIAPGGVLIVLGNFDGENGSIINSGNVVVAGEIENLITNSVSGTGDFYVFDDDPFIEGFIPTGGETEMQANDPDLYDFFMDVRCGEGISGGTIGYDQSLCADSTASPIENITLASPGSAFSYSWYFSTNSANPSTGTWTLIPGSVSTEYTPVIPAVTTSYYRRATVGSGCTVNSNAVTITIKDLPVVSITGNTETCEGTEVTLNAGAGHPEYTWSLNGTYLGNQQQQVITTPSVAVPDNFTVISCQVIVEDTNGCKKTAVHEITVHRLPVTLPVNHINTTW